MVMFSVAGNETIPCKDSCAGSPQAEGFVS